MLLGADEVAVIADAKALHSSIGGAPLFAIWGAGSFIGGLLLTRLGGGARTAAGLALLLGALTAGHLALIPADGSVFALGAVLLVAGAAIAPTEATLYAMVDQAAPDSTITEAFAWLATAMAVGSAAGAAGAGIVADRAGPAAAFALAGAAGALALLTSLLRSRTIGTATSRVRQPASRLPGAAAAFLNRHQRPVGETENRIAEEDADDKCLRASEPAVNMQVGGEDS